MRHTHSDEERNRAREKLIRLVFAETEEAEEISNNDNAKTVSEQTKNLMH